MYVVYFWKRDTLKCFIFFQIYQNIKDTYITCKNPIFNDDHIGNNYII